MKYYSLHGAFLEEYYPGPNHTLYYKTIGMPSINPLSCFTPYEIARIMCYGNSTGR